MPKDSRTVTINIIRVTFEKSQWCMAYTVQQMQKQVNIYALQDTY